MAEHDAVDDLWLEMSRKRGEIYRADGLQVEIDRRGCRVALVLTTEAVEIRLPTVEWPGPHSPVATTRLWKRVDWSEVSDSKALRALLDAAAKERRREFIPCRFCRRRTPPEHRHDDVCHSCAEGYLGVVH